MTRRRGGGQILTGTMTNTVIRLGEHVRREAMDLWPVVEPELMLAAGIARRVDNYEEVSAAELGQMRLALSGVRAALTVHLAAAEAASKVEEPAPRAPVVSLADRMAKASGK